MTTTNRRARKTAAPATQPASPEAVADNASAYAKKLEEQFNKQRQARATQPSRKDGMQLLLDALPKSNSLENEVAWQPPKEIDLHLGPPQSSRGPDKVTPVETPAANTPAAATDKGTNPGPVLAEQHPVPPSLREDPISSDALAQKLLKQLNSDPKNLSALVDWQLLQLLTGHPVPEMLRVGKLPAEDHEIVSALMDAMITFRSTLHNDDNAMFSKKARPFIEMADRLRTQAGLRVATVALCSRVDGFGVYEPVDPTKFREGRDHRVVLYFEVENFASRLTETRQWETRLTESAILYDYRGQRVWEDGKELIVDSSRNKRHDFFGRRRIQLPANLKPGKYSLKVSVTDQLASRFAEESLAVEVLEQ